MSNDYTRTRALQRIKEARDDILDIQTTKNELERMYDDHRAYSPGHKGCCLAYVVVLKTLDEKLAEALQLQKQVRRGRL